LYPLVSLWQHADTTKGVLKKANYEENRVVGWLYGPLLGK
jgi:hypothetical protein